MGGQPGQGANRSKPYLNASACQAVRCRSIPGEAAAERQQLFQPRRQRGRPSPPAHRPRDGRQLRRQFSVHRRPGEVWWRVRPARCDRASASRSCGAESSARSRRAAGRSARARPARIAQRHGGSGIGAVDVIDHHLAVAVDRQAVRAALHRRFEQRDQRAVFGLAAVAVAGAARNFDALAGRSREQRADAAIARVRMGRAVEPRAPCSGQAVVPALAPRQRGGALLLRAAARAASAASQRIARGQQLGQRAGAGAAFERRAQRLLRRAAGAARPGGGWRSVLI